MSTVGGPGPCPWCGEPTGQQHRDFCPIPTAADEFLATGLAPQDFHAWFKSKYPHPGAIPPTFQPLPPYSYEPGIGYTCKGCGSQVGHDHDAGCPAITKYGHVDGVGSICLECGLKVQDGHEAGCTTPPLAGPQTPQFSFPLLKVGHAAPIFHEPGTRMPVDGCTCTGCKRQGLVDAALLDERIHDKVRIFALRVASGQFDSKPEQALVDAAQQLRREMGDEDDRWLDILEVHE